MDIVKVFADNLKKYRCRMGLSQEPLPANAGCIGPISAPSNAIAAAYPWKTFSASQMRWRSRPINCFWRIELHGIQRPGRRLEAREAFGAQK